MRIKHAPTRSSQNAESHYAALRERIFDIAFRVKLRLFDNILCLYVYWFQYTGSTNVD